MIFRKKPALVVAARWNGTYTRDLEDVLKGHECVISDSGSLTVPTLHGDTTAEMGDWVVRGEAGDIWPCKHSIFEETYDPVPAAAA